MSLLTAGIAIIALAWLLQLTNADKKDIRLRRSFLLTYGIGTALIVAEHADAGLSTNGWLYLITLLVLALLYIRVHY